MYRTKIETTQLSKIQNAQISNIIFWQQGDCHAWPILLLWRNYNCKNFTRNMGHFAPARLQAVIRLIIRCQDIMHTTWRLLILLSNEKGQLSNEIGTSLPWNCP